MKNWYIRNNDSRLGPYSYDDLTRIELFSDDYIWKDEFTTWTKANAIPELKHLVVPVEQCNFTLKVNVQRMFPVSYTLKRPKERVAFVNPAAILFHAFAKGRALVLRFTQPQPALRPALGE